MGVRNLYFPKISEMWWISTMCYDNYVLTAGMKLAVEEKIGVLNFCFSRTWGVLKGQKEG